MSAYPRKIFMKKTVLYIFFCVLLLIPRAGAQTVSITRALELMQQNNDTLKGEKAKVQTAAYKLKETKGLRYPSLSIMGSYVHLNDDLKLNLNDYRDKAAGLLQITPSMLGSWDIKVQDQDFGLIAANLTWPLYTGGKITSAIKAAGFESRIARVETTQTENRLICLLVDRYYLLKLTQEALKVRQHALETCQAHLFNARKLEEQGMIAVVETMQAQTAVSDAQRETAAALKDIELARAALTGVIGKQDLTIHHLSSPLFEFSLDHDLDYYRQLAKDNYPAIVKAGLMEKLAEQNKKVQQAGFLPQIALLGSKNLYTDNLALDDCNYEWFVGLGMTLSLFNGMQDTNRVRRAQSLITSISLQKKQVKKDIQVLVEKHYLEISKYKEQYQALETDLDAARELLRARNRSFAEGLSDSVQVADASLYLSAIELKRLKALYGMDTSLARLLELCGQSSYFTRYANQ